MPTKCVVFGCKNKAVYKETEGKISFFRFPKKPYELRDAWVKAVKWRNWTPSPSSSVCSDHFAEQDLDRTSLSSLRLRPDAVPTIFPHFPPHLRKMKHRRNVKILRLHSDDSMSDSSFDDVEEKPQVVSVSTPSEDNVEQSNHKSEEPSSTDVAIIVIPTIAQALTVTPPSDHSGMSLPPDIDPQGASSSTPALDLKPRKVDVAVSVEKNSINPKKAGAPPNVPGQTKKSSISAVHKQMNASTMCFTSISREPELKWQMMSLSKKYRINQQKLKTAQQRIRRLSKANEKLAREMKALKDNCKPEATIERLHKVAGVNSQILKRQLCKSTGAIEVQEYGEDLRRFAMILYSHSIKAYEFVRQSFGGCLPHPRTIGEWRHPTKKTAIIHQ